MNTFLEVRLECDKVITPPVVSTNSCFYFHVKCWNVFILLYMPRRMKLFLLSVLSKKVTVP